MPDSTEGNKIQVLTGLMSFSPFNLWYNVLWFSFPSLEGQGGGRKLDSALSSLLHTGHGEPCGRKKFVPFLGTKTVKKGQPFEVM